MTLKRKIQKRLRGLWGDIRPESLQIEVTNACNFHCLMCPFHGPEKASGRAVGFIDPDRYRRVVSEFRDWGGNLVIPQGAGESFLHPDFPALLEYTKRESGLRVAFTTNGSRVSSGDLDMLIDLGVDEVGFSVDALSPEVFRTITGGDLAHVEATVEKLCELRRSHHSGTPLIRVLLVAQDYNRREIEAYIQRWLPVVDEVVIQACRTHAGRTLETPRKEPRKPCRHLFDTAFVQWDGEMVICCEDWESVSSIGNVFDKGLRALWRNSELESFRRNQKRGIFSPPSICRQCEAWAGGMESRMDNVSTVELTTALTRVIRRKDAE